MSKRGKPTPQKSLKPRPMTPAPKAPLRRVVSRVSDDRISRVTAPVSSGTVRTLGKPVYVSAPDGGVRIRHREYYDDVYADTTAFGATSVSINPGVPSIFPWLSSIARGFESYTFNSLSFEYEPYCSTAVTGEVLMAMDYDTTDTIPNNKQQMSTNRTFIRSNLWLGCKMSCPKVDLVKFARERFVRSYIVAGTDLKTYDMGRLIVATNNGTGGYQYGSIYIEYDITFRTPSLPDALADSQFFYNDTTIDAGITMAGPFASTAALAFANNSQVNSLVSVGLKGVLSDYPAGYVHAPNRIYFNSAGKYLLETIFKTSGAGSTFTVSPTSGVALTNISVYNSISGGLLAAGSYLYNGKWLANVTTPGYVEFTGATNTLQAVDVVATLLAPYVQTLVAKYLE